MLFDRLAVLFALTQLALAEQPSAPSPVEAPLRELPWGQLNFLHTTDTHGWHGGHLQEAQYSADWGDYISFAHHLHKRADDDGSDLLLIDTGDRVEGNGLYDASNPKGKYTFGILSRQHIDVITSGNHELYLRNSSENEFYHTVPDFKGNYIASNLDIHNPKTGDLEPLAPRYRKFTTKNQGIRILALGFLYNFHGNANNTIVQPVQETVKEKWFQDAIHDRDVDLFLVAGHVPVRDSEEYDLIYQAIREVQWDTPIAFFGGHTHIRDYKKWEKKAQGIESGRYMETIGFLSISGLNAGGKPKKELSRRSDASDMVLPQIIRVAPEYKRLYIDNNLYSLHHHSGTNSSTFDTSLGRNVSATIDTDRKKLKLDHTFGCAPHDLWLNRAPYPSKSSLLSWLEKQVIPDTFKNCENAAIVISNTGALRFDIFKGPFTIDTTFLVSPFTSAFRQIDGVPYGVASQVLRILNNEGQISLSNLLALASAREDGWGAHKLHELLPPLPPVNLATLQRQQLNNGPSGAVSPQQAPIAGATDKPLIPGYTTSDDLGRDGDDTLHEAIRFYDVPNCIGVNHGFDPADTEKAPKTVDLVYNEFIQDWVLLALRYLGATYEKKDTRSVDHVGTMTEVISGWVGKHWECKR